MRHLDLFSGIGGFALAADWVWPGQVEHIFCEIEPFCQKVLRKHWPEAVIISDIRELTVEKVMAHAAGGNDSRIAREIQGENEQQESQRPQGGITQFSNASDIRTTGISQIDLLTGGFPCQPFSTAGKRRGKEDDRFLWPEMLRVIRETRPHWVIGENVAGFVNMALDDCIADLEREGYEVQAFVIPACAVNAPHRRDRVWIVANPRDNQRGHSITGSIGRNGRGEFHKAIWTATAITTARPSATPEFIPDAQCQRQQGQRLPEYASDTAKNGQGQANESLDGRIRNQWSVESRLGRVAHGIPNRVDRLKGLGNAIVPQVAAVIMQAIKECDE
jgi:DNA (cytosine-5)-methyltransferase 1